MLDDIQYIFQYYLFISKTKMNFTVKLNGKEYKGNKDTLIEKSGYFKNRINFEEDQTKTELTELDVSTDAIDIRQDWFENMFTSWHVHTNVPLQLPLAQQLCYCKMLRYFGSKEKTKNFIHENGIRLFCNRIRIGTQIFLLNGFRGSPLLFVPEVAIKMLNDIVGDVVFKEICLRPTRWGGDFFEMILESTDLQINKQKITTTDRIGRHHPMYLDQYIFETIEKATNEYLE